MQSTSVSGALTYKVLCVAAKNEKRLAQLRKRQLQYVRQQYVTHQSGLLPSQWSSNSSKKSSDQGTPQKTLGKVLSRPAVRCYKCNKVGHYAKDCRSRQTESSGEKLKATNVKQVNAAEFGAAEIEQREDPHQYLQADSPEEDKQVQLVQVPDRGGRSHRARLLVYS